MTYVPLSVPEQISNAVSNWPAAAKEVGQNYGRMALLDAALFCDAFLDVNEANMVSLSVDYVTNVRSDLRLGAVVTVKQPNTAVGAAPGSFVEEKFMLCADSGALITINNTQDLVDVWTQLYEAGIRVVFGDTTLIDPPPNLDLKAPDTAMGERLLERYKATQAQRAKLTTQLESLHAKVSTKAVKARIAENTAREKALGIRCGVYTGLIQIFAPDLVPSD